MPAHATEHRFDQGRPFAASRPRHGPRHGLGHGLRIVAVDRLTGHAVAQGPVREPLGGELLGGRRRERVPVVLDHQDQGQPPDRGHVEAFVEVARRGAAIADEVEGDTVRAGLLEGIGTARGHRDHRAEVADHAEVTDAVGGIEVAVMERALDAARKAVVAAEELADQAVEHVVRLGTQAVRSTESALRKGASGIQVGGEDRAEVAVQATQHIARLEGQAGGDGRGLGTDLAVPLGQATGEQQGAEAAVQLARQGHEGEAGGHGGRRGGRGRGRADDGRRCLVHEAVEPMLRVRRWASVPAPVGGRQIISRRRR